MSNLKIDDSNIIYISQFGSYGTSEWISGISDIDIGIVVKHLDDINPYLEDEMKQYFEQEYSYNNVNITFAEFDIESKLLRNIICGKTVYSTFDEKTMKRKCLYIENSVQYQRTYYELGKLECLRNEVNDLW